MINRIIHYIGLSKIGWLEFIIALYPILAGYGYGAFKLAFGVLFFLDVIIFIKGGNKRVKCLPLTIFCVYLILHDILIIPLLPNVPSYFINSLISTIIYVISLFVIAPQLNYQKFRSSIYIVAIICMIGLIYHVSLLSLGKTVSPIKLPFLPEMAQNTRLYSISQRPTSFFWEPQSYASFMLAPLFFALYDRKIIYAFIIAALMIVSTSTTGLILGMSMFFFSFFSSGNKWYMRFIIFFSFVALGYFLISSSYTVAGLEKFQNTEFEETNRIVNGFLIAREMNFYDLITGIPFANVQDAYNAGYFSSPVVVLSDGVLFISAIWIALVRYGLGGLILFLLSYFWIYKKDKLIFPYLACVVLGHFSNPDFMGASYVFQIIVMLVFISRNFYTIQTRNYASPKSYISVR